MTITAKILEVTAFELNWDEEVESTYTFVAYELPNGAIMVPGETTNDWYFTDRDSVEVSGNAVVSSIEDTAHTVEFTEGELRASLEGSVREFDSDEATDKAYTLLVA